MHQIKKAKHLRTYIEHHSSYFSKSCWYRSPSEFADPLSIFPYGCPTPRYLTERATASFVTPLPLTTTCLGYLMSAQTTACFHTRRVIAACRLPTVFNFRPSRSMCYMSPPRIVTPSSVGFFVAVDSGGYLYMRQLVRETCSTLVFLGYLSAHLCSVYYPMCATLFADESRTWGHTLAGVCKIEQV